ncbi:hypothetical protein [Jiangella asiatica]|uniref:Sigma-70 family RNA polymerase sigma factor n=1 Tax=Jiangella asiatica TaxID=2530372 RepID=A0A4R5CFM0_9ACTN|nr:hypothetical protein [Jiangella asiatica]TDD96032.1 hypothetical protein E1269_30815 [Jiangella asiatica]
MKTMPPSIDPHALITDQLNAEWRGLSGRPVPRRWPLAALPGCDTLGDAFDTIAWARRHQPAAADQMLLTLLTLRTENGDDLAGRLVLQALLGRSVNLARRAHRIGSPGLRGDLPQLTAAAVGALWHAIAAYPLLRRPRKVSVNLCMDTLAHFTTVLDDRAPEAVDIALLESAEPVFSVRGPAPALEVLDALSWGIGVRVITPEDASLLLRVYCPSPGHDGGALAVARELGLTPATVRQRCSRAVQRLAAAVRSHRKVWADAA